MTSEPTNRLRRFAVPEIATLAQRMRSLIEHPAMTAWLDVAAPSAHWVYEGQSALDGLRARGRELPWADRMLAAHDGRPLRRLPTFSRRWAATQARGFLAMDVSVSTRAAAEAEEYQGAAAGLLEYIGKTVETLEAVAASKGGAS